MFNQAIFHPMVNAVKFNKQRGTIKLKLTTRRLPTSQTLLQCELTDEGIGIAPNNLKLLFSAFNVGKREHLQTKGSSPFSSTAGVGLGLSTTKSLVKIQSGDVRIESEIGQYTTVTMFIVVDTRRPEAVEAKERESSSFFEQLGFKEDVPKTGFENSTEDGSSRPKKKQQKA